MLLPLLDTPGEDPSQSPCTMLETDPIETVDAERYAAAAHTQATGPSSKPGASATASRRSRHRPP